MVPATGRTGLGPAAAVLLGFVLLTGLAIYLASRARHTLLHSQVTRTLHTSGQFAVRSIMFILTVLVVLSMVLGLDMLLGAFAACVLWKVAMARAPEQDRHVIEAKIDAIAFGFLVPIFFIDTGIDFDLRALTSSPATLALVPLFLLLLLVIRGLPSVLAAPPGSSAADKRAVVLFGATGLPIILAVTAIGQKRRDHLKRHRVGAGWSGDALGASVSAARPGPASPQPVMARTRARKTGQEIQPCGPVRSNLLLHARPRPRIHLWPGCGLP